MSEAEVSKLAVEDGVQALVGGSNAGVMLRKAREAQGLHIAMLAVALKVPVKKIEAIEDNRFDLLPDMVFVRALASSICRSLKVDEQAVLAALPKSAPPKIAVEGDGHWASYKDNRGALQSSWRVGLANPWGISVGLVVVAILVILWWPQLVTLAEAMMSPRAPTLMDQPIVAAPSVDTPAAEPLAVSSSQQSESAQPLANNDNILATGVTTPIAQNTAISAPAAALVKPLLLTATATSWVEVVDGDGLVLLKKSMYGGESMAIGGKPPLQVVLGRAAAIQVRVNDQVFDTTPFVRENVARFEVK